MHKPDSINRPEDCVVVTCFGSNQPGYLDFSYRIQALAARYRLIILSEDELTQLELQVPSATYRPLGRGEGKLGWWRYLLRCAVHIRKARPGRVVLLHSSAAPIALLIGSIPVCTYWNEHPTNIVKLPDGFSPLDYFLGKFSHWLVFMGARRAHLVMPIGEEHENELVAHGVPRERMQMIYMGVADRFAECAISTVVKDTGYLELIYVGTVSKPRGRDVLLEAMPLVAKAGERVRLTIIGASDDQLAYCRNRMRELGVQDEIQVLGRVSGTEIPHHLAQADIGICLWEDRPWWRFNPPTKLFEYLAAGLPVLASNIRTHTRYIQNEVNGFIFDYRAADLARAIIEISRRRQMLAQMRANAAQAGQQYLWSRIEPDFIKAVEAVSHA